MPFREPPPPRGPRSVRDLVERLAERRGWKERLAVGRLQERWAEVAGPAVAARSEPIRLEGGVLTIRVEAGAWATELSLLRTTLAARAETVLGPGSVRDVRVVAGGLRRVGKDP